MPYFKTTYTMLIAAGLAVGGLAFAQDTVMEPAGEPASETNAGADHFTAADVNTDGTLNRYEYIAYVNARADAGDVDYITLRDGGNLDAMFKIKDSNDDGFLDRDELEAV